MKKFYFLLLSFLALSLCANAVEEPIYTLSLASSKFDSYDKSIAFGDLNWTASVGSGTAAVNKNTIDNAGQQFGTTSKTMIPLTFTYDNANSAKKLESITKVEISCKLSSTSYPGNLEVIVNDGNIGKTQNISTKNQTSYSFEGDVNSVNSLIVKFTPSKSNKGGFVLYTIKIYGTFKSEAAAAVEDPEITETSKPDLGSSYLTTSTAKATISCKTNGASIKYAITDGTKPADAEWREYSSEVGVSINSEVAGNKILWAKAVNGTDKSKVVSKEFTFATEPEGTYFVLVTDASQIVEGAKYIIVESNGAAVMGDTYKTNYSLPVTSDFTVSGGVLLTPDATAFATIELEAIADATYGYDWYVKFKEADGSYTYLKGSARDLAYTETAVEGASISISAEDNTATISFKSNDEGYHIRYNGSLTPTRFKTYKTPTGTPVYLYRLVKEVPVETTTGLDKVISGKVGRNYQIKAALRVNYKDDNYAYASTTENNSSKKNTANEGDKGLGWSDKEDKFTQNDWVAIQNSGLELGNQVAIGSVATLVSNGAFPVIEFVSMSKDAPETPFEANTFRVANFNIGKDENAVKNVWLVAPQAGEYCHVRGYVAAAEGGKVTLKSAQESSTEIIGGTPITVDPVKMTVNYTGAVTTGNWFSFTGIVVNGTNGLELNAISAEDVSTGVEGVEASSVKVYGAEGVINVVSEEVAPIAVYSANGAIVSSVEASSASIAVAPGFYIVKAGNSVSKVTVK